MLCLQVASSFLIETGDGDKFLFDMGSGSYQNLLATGNYAIDKVGALSLVRWQGCCRLIQTQHAVWRQPALSFGPMECMPTS